MDTCAPYHHNLLYRALYSFPLSISPKNISRINLLLHIIQTTIIPIRNNRLAHLFKLLKIIYHLAAKECAVIFQRRLVNNDGRASGFDSLHDALNGKLAEVVRVAFHDQAVYTYYYFVLHCRIVPPFAS